MGVMRISLWIFLVLVGGAIAFELHPAVQQGRSLIPDQVYTNPECGCLCLIESRPWYSTFNYWFWLWVVAVPVLAFGINKDWSLRRKLLVAGLITLFCYGALNLSVGLMWDIRNAPFIVSSEPDIEWQKAWDMKCATIADGASTIFSLLLGWIPAALYTGLWLGIAHTYRRFKPKAG